MLVFSAHGISDWIEQVAPVAIHVKPEFKVREAITAELGAFAASRDWAALLLELPLGIGSRA